MLPLSAYQLCFLNSLYLSEYKKKHSFLQGPRKQALHMIWGETDLLATLTLYAKDRRKFNTRRKSGKGKKENNNE